MEITLCVSRDAVMAEVVQATSYAGAKMDGDAGAYERISVTEDNVPELLRFWDECRAELAQAFMRMLVREGMCDDGVHYELVLDVSVAFDMALLPGMQLGLFSYFVQMVSAKWYVYSNKKEAGDYAQMGRGLLAELKEKAYFKRRPVRPCYD